MRIKRMKRESERLCDAVSFRVSPKQRMCLERVAEESNIGLCAAARLLLDAGIKARGI